MAQRLRGPSSHRQQICIALAVLGGLLASSLHGSLASLAGLKPPPQVPEVPPPESSPSSTPQLWTDAARRVADGKADAGAYLETAWQSTEAFWLRPWAYAFAVCAGLATGLPRRVAEAGDKVRVMVVRPTGLLKRQEGDPVAPPKRKNYLTKADCSAAVQALRRLELPFFASSAVWEERPARGIVVRGRFRPGLVDNLLEAEAETRGTLEQHLGEELGRPVRVHVLRAEPVEGEDASEGATYELFLTEQLVPANAVNTYSFSVMTLMAAVWACFQVGGAADVSRLVGGGAAVLVKGSMLPVGMLFAALGMAELVRGLVTKGLGSTWAPPAFLPSPQLGLLGIFPGAKQEPFRSRSDALLGALAGPVTLTAVSLALLAYGSMTGDLSMTLEADVSVAWPLALIPEHCSAAVWAGVHGLLMASLMLLPHSPQGQLAWTGLVGRKTADQLAAVCSYLYPILGLVMGSGWFFLPMWWAFLIVNVGVSEILSPKEEVSPLPDGLKYASGTVLVLAALAMLPLPLDMLLLNFP